MVRVMPYVQQIRRLETTLERIRDWLTVDDEVVSITASFLKPVIKQIDKVLSEVREEQTNG